MHTLGGSWRRLTCLSPCHPRGRPGLRPQILPSAWLSPVLVVGNWEVDQQMDDLCLCLSTGGGANTMANLYWEEETSQHILIKLAQGLSGPTGEAPAYNGFHS